MRSLPKIQSDGKEFVFSNGQQIEVGSEQYKQLISGKVARQDIARKVDCPRQQAITNAHQKVFGGSRVFA